MKRATRAILVFVVLAGATAGMVWVERRAADHAPAITALDGETRGDAGTGSSAKTSLASDQPDASLPLDGAVASVARLDDRNKDAGATLLDGALVPELSAEPKSLVFGVILVQYQGAQGARSGARSHDEAQQLAEQLAELAKNDFEAAVKKGDPGSTDNAGRMFRNILEPAPEFVLFSLEPGEVGGPVDTPRGFWVVKRIE